MAELYRKSALERISSPEQLDKALTVTSPISWIALVGITVIVVVSIIWSILGTIPVTVSTQGIISPRVGTNSVYVADAGTVVSVSVRPGMEVHIGDELCRYRTSSNEMRTVYSDQVGEISEVVVHNGDALSPGVEIVRVAPKTVNRQVAVCYVPLGQVAKLERGMTVQVYLDGVDSQAKGHMTARITNIDAYAASSSAMASVLGANNNLISTFQQAGAVVAVACEFYPGDTASGYYWTNEKGGDVLVPNGALISAKITTEEVAPITKLFSNIAEIWGD